jgi:two-component system chemotaxis sensor kinase CheA
MFEHDPEVLASFAEESLERLNSLEVGLLALERTPSPAPELLNSLFRDAHSIKAAANLLNFSTVESSAHCLEHVLDRLRTKRLSNGPEVCQALFEGLDLLRELVSAPAAPVPADVPQRLAALAALSAS